MPVHDEHVQRLVDSAVMFERADLLFTVAAPAGIPSTAGVIFLEKGNEDAGWNHIVKHLEDFKRYGLRTENFQDLLENKLATEPETTAYEMRNNRRGTLAGYVVKGDREAFTMYVAIGSNGFVVTAHPYEMSAEKYYRQLKKMATTRRDGMQIAAAYIGLAGYSAHE